MLQAILLMGGLGIIIGIILSAASKIFYVYVDPLILELDDALPGANCGGCGLPGCSANAEAIANGEAGPDSCVAGGDDLTAALAAIMGVSVEAKEPDFALPGCTYNVEESDTKYHYEGLTNCRAAALMNGGMKVCNIGCLGLGSCVTVCKFGALQIGESGLPVVDQEKCTGCGACEVECPKNIINLTSVTRRIIHEYTTDNCTTPCQRSCPAGIKISDYIGEIAKGEYNKAIQIIKERNPFPTVIGRICPRPCETSCRRELVDESVAINYLKRFAADYEIKNGRVLPYKAPSTGRKIAIIGGGVQGLSAGFFAARLGHDPSIFEASSETGGLLRKAISKNRLSMDILDWDIKGVLEMGVEVETNKKMGVDVTVESLFRDDFQAIFISSGGWDNRMLQGSVSEPENTIPGTYLLIDLIKNSGSVNIDGNVVIAGSDKLTLNAVKECKQKGIENITVLFRESENDLPVESDVIDSVVKEGAKISYNSSISRLIGENDKLNEIEIINLETKEKTIVKSDNLIIGSGRFPDLTFIKQETEEEENNQDNKTIKWQGIESFKVQFNRGLLSKEDPLTDFTAAINAISAGRRGAAAIHQALYNLNLFDEEIVISEKSDIQNVSALNDVGEVPRQIMPLKVVNEMSTDEIELGYDLETAKKEAKRCLKCGLVCYKKDSDILIMENKESA